MNKGHFLLRPICLFYAIFLFGIFLGWLFLPGIAIGAPSFITVDSSADTVVSGDGFCTLREAVANINSDTDTSGGDCVSGNGIDTIRFSSALIGQTITLSGTEISITNNLSIIGLGASQLTLSANSNSRVFNVISGTVFISGMTIRDGQLTDTNGAGIANVGTLTLDRMVVTANNITGGTATQGGGIFNTGTLTVTHSAIYGNNALGSSGRGGGIASIGDTAIATIINSTISENTAAASGGGLVNADSSVMNLSFVTIVDNSATNFDGGGIEVLAATTLKNSIVANNLANGNANDCNYLFTQPTSQGYNLVEAVGNCSTFVSTGDITDSDPQLAAMADNGGDTVSFMPQNGSPTIDVIPVDVNGCNPAATATDDQRGYLRVGNCTIGAVEYNGIHLTMRKLVDDTSADPAQTVNYSTVVNLASSGNVSITHGLLLDSLPTGINFVGPITVIGTSGTAGTLPTLGHDIALSGGESITFTFPVTVSTGLAGGTTIENSTSVTTSEVVASVIASTVLTVNNVAPIAPDDTFSVLEDSGNTAFSIQDNDFDLNGDTLTVSAVGVPDNGGSTAENSGEIDYSPATNFNGTETFSYTLSDGSLSDTALVTVTVTPVNDAPSFTKGDSPWLLQTDGAQNILSWATGISVGPADELGQTLTFDVSTDQSELFTTQPAIDTVSGNLTFTPVATMSGTATMTATLSDDGGTANGGADTSAPQNVTITIVPGDVAKAVDAIGGSLIYANGDVTGTVQFPASAVDVSTTFVYDEIAEASHPALTGYAFAGRIFTLNAYQNHVLQSNFIFSSPITLTLDYTPDDVQFADENSLEVRYWNGSAWASDGITLLQRDTINHRITVSVSHLSEFALMGLSPILNVDTTVSGEVSPVAGGTLTYTIALSNRGALTAHSITMSDTLPSGVNFGGWVQQGAAMVASDVVSWGISDVVSFTTITIAFTATVSNGEIFADSTITNTARFVSADAGTGSSAAMVSVGNISRIYLPLILK